ncbi:MAG TPA: hypothetical protein VGN00_18815, partial [Puia sp.]
MNEVNDHSSEYPPPFSSPFSGSGGGGKGGGMKRFAELFVLLGTSTKTNDKLDALTSYFAVADDRDKVWVIALFSGRKPKRTVNATQLQEWCRELTGLAQWLFEESYHTVGDLAETIALLLPEPEDTVDGQKQAADDGISSGKAEDTGGAVGGNSPSGDSSLSWYLEKLMEIGKEQEDVKKKFVIQCWQQMGRDERLVFNKLITGGFRIGISQKMIVNALAKTVGVTPSII